MSDRHYDIEWYREVNEKEEVYEVHGTVSTIVRGRSFGPPESCYPDEGGEAEITKITDQEDRTVPLDIFTEEELRDMEYRLFQKACEDDEPEYDYDELDQDFFAEDVEYSNREDD